LAGLKVSAAQVAGSTGMKHAEEVRTLAAARCRIAVARRYVPVRRLRRGDLREAGKTQLWAD